MDLNMSDPQGVFSSADFREFHSDLALIKTKADRMCKLAREKLGPESTVTYRAEDVSYSLQRLNWELLRIEK